MKNLFTIAKFYGDSASGFIKKPILYCFFVMLSIFTSGCKNGSIFGGEDPTPFPTDYVQIERIPSDAYFENWISNGNQIDFLINKNRDIFRGCVGVNFNDDEDMELNAPAYVGTEKRTINGKSVTILKVTSKEYRLTISLDVYKKIKESQFQFFSATTGIKLLSTSRCKQQFFVSDVRELKVKSLE